MDFFDDFVSIEETWLRIIVGSYGLLWDVVGDCKGL